MTSTKIITAAALAVAGGELQSPVKAVLAAGTGAYNLEVIVTNPAVPLPEIPTHPYVEVCSISTNDAGAASIGLAAELSLNRNTKTTKMKVGKSERTFDHSDVYAVNGANVHVWLNAPRLPAGCLVDVWLNEF